MAKLAAAHLELLTDLAKNDLNSKYYSCDAVFCVSILRTKHLPSLCFQEMLLLKTPKESFQNKLTRKLNASCQAKHFLC